MLLGKVRKSCKAVVSTLSFVALLLVAQSAFAAEGLADIVGRIQEQILTIGPLLTIIAYLSGVGFCIAGIVQFKAHKDNPAQVPLSKPIVYLCVGAGLLFLPTIMQSAGSTLFGGSESSAGMGDTGLQ
jgi:intracellular multiplication protein IcmD